jgi:large subunit ribosomal protein L25
MPTYEKLEITERDVTGSKGARALRRAGKVPAVFYFHGQDNVNLAIDRKHLLKVLHSGHHIFEVNIDGQRQFVMVKDVQYHPVTDEIIHVDLMRVRRSEKVTISVPVELVGEAVGVKKGGLLMQNLTTIELNCLPTDVPDNIPVDVSALDLHDSLSVAELSFPEGMEVVTPGETVVVTVQMPPAWVREEVPAEEVAAIPEVGVPPAPPPAEAAPEESPDES